MIKSGFGVRMLVEVIVLLGIQDTKWQSAALSFSDGAFGISWQVLRS